MAKTEEIQAEEQGKAIAIDSDEREGNDIPTLIGSGAPMITIQANMNIMGLQTGEVGTFLQTEELRLLAQQGNVSVVRS
jgi:hypothetical protein